MGQGRTRSLGSLVDAVAALVAPRDGESRREALTRLGAGLRRRGGVSAFAGTPCAHDRGAAGVPPSATGDAGPEGNRGDHG